MPETEPLKTPRRRWTEHAGALITQADELSSYTMVNFGLSMEASLLDASAGRSGPGNQGDPAEFAALLDEINSILSQQEAAAESQRQCWNNLRNSFQALAPGAQNASPAKREEIAKELANALALFQKCLLRPRPIRVA